MFCTNPKAHRTNEKMSSHGCHVDVKSDKAFWTVVLGFILSLNVCDAVCPSYNLKDTMTLELLADHWFQVKKFISPADSEEDKYVFLSVINTLCSTLEKNHERLSNKCMSDVKDCTDSRDRVTWTYEEMLKNLLNKPNHTYANISHNECSTYKCSNYLKFDYVSVATFVDMFLRTCTRNITSAECPPKQTTPPSTTSSSLPTCIPSSATNTTPPSTTSSNNFTTSLPFSATNTTPPSTTSSNNLTTSLPSSATNTTRPSTTSSNNLTTSLPSSATNTTQPSTTSSNNLTTSLPSSATNTTQPSTTSSNNLTTSLPSSATNTTQPSTTSSNNLTTSLPSSATNSLSTSLPSSAKNTLVNVILTFSLLANLIFVLQYLYRRPHKSKTRCGIVCNSKNEDQLEESSITPGETTPMNLFTNCMNYEYSIETNIGTGM